MSMDDNGNTDFPAEKGISDLPLELVSHIFTFLTIADVQEARLVCSQWYIASQAPALLEREKVVPSKECGCTSPDDLLKSSRKLFNLKLMDITNAVWYSEKLWSQFGQTLRYLSFCYCNVKEEQILRVLSHCKRLKSLEINECDLIFSSDPQVTEVKENETTPLKLLYLQSLKIANIFELRCDVFDKIVDSAPNLTSLSLDDCLTDWWYSTKEEERPPYLTFKHIVEYLSKKTHRINSLHVSGCGDECYDIFIMATSPNLQLKKFRTDYRHVAAVIKYQLWLQEIDLSCYASDQLLQTICLYLPELKRLTLRFCSEVTYLGLVELPLLKKLTSLHLFECHQVSGKAILTSLCNNINLVLKELTLTDLYVVSHLHVAALAKAHPALTYLDLSYCVGVTDWSVQAIFRYQKSLQTLKLIECGNLSDYGLIGNKMISSIFRKNVSSGSSLACKYLLHLKCCDDEGYFNPTGCGISELKNLQKLDLSNCSSMTGVSFMSGLKLPALRHLILDNNTISTMALKRLFENNRTLENVEMSNCCGVTSGLIPVIIKNLKRLKSIDLEDCNVSPQSIVILKRHCKRVKD